MFAPALRDESYRRGMDTMLKRVEFQCGLAYGTLSDPQNVDKTAEEIRSSKQRSYTTVKDLQRALGNALTDLVYSISKLLDAQWNSGTAVSPPGDCNVTFDFDDSIISDPKERKQMYWGYVTAGKFPFWRYLVEFEGYSEDDAKAIAAEADAENRSPEALTFGGALMLPPSYLDQMPDAFVQLWQQVEDDILRDVARRISKMEALTPTANWQLWRYQQTEALRNDVVKLLAKYTGKSETAIRKLLLQAATEAMEREDAIYYHYDMEPPPFEESAALNNLLDAGARQTCGTWQNLTATTANTVTGAFERTLDAAWLKVSTGAFDYKAAVKQAVDSLADEAPWSHTQRA